METMGNLLKRAPFQPGDADLAAWLALASGQGVGTPQLAAIYNSDDPLFTGLYVDYEFADTQAVVNTTPIRNVARTGPPFSGSMKDGGVVVAVNGNSPWSWGVDDVFGTYLQHDQGGPTEQADRISVGGYLSASSRTFEMIFRMSADQAGTGILWGYYDDQAWDGDGSYVGISVTDDGYLHVRGSRSLEWAYAGGIVPGQWYHMIVSLAASPGVTNLWVNGVVNPMASSGPPMLPFTPTGMMGSTSEDVFVGRLALARKWNRALSSAEATRLFANPWCFTAAYAPPSSSYLNGQYGALLEMLSQ